MPEEHRSVYCRRCGNALQEGDEFCGVCGASVPSHAQATGPTREISSPVQPPTHVAPASVGRRRMPRWVVPVVLLVVMVVSTGALAYAALVPGDGAGQQAPEPEAGAPPAADEGPTTPSVAPDSPPDPAFDLLLPALKGLTTAPIMLPAELENEFENVGIDDSMEGDRYGLTFLTTPPEDLVGTWPRFEIIGSLRAVPASESEPDQRFEATSTGDVELPDGTEAELRYMEPVGEVVNYGPRWEGTFDKDGYSYTLEMSGYGKEVVEQALSTMVLVEKVAGEPESDPADDSERERLRSFVSGYYEAALDREDWEATYAMLDGASRGGFTKEEWARKQQALQDADPNYPPAPLETVTIDDVLEGEGRGTVVDLTLGFEDGTQETLDIEVVWEGDGYKRHLTEEEASYLEGAVGAGEETGTDPYTEGAVDAGDGSRDPDYQVLGIINDTDTTGMLTGSDIPTARASVVTSSYGGLEEIGRELSLEGEREGYDIVVVDFSVDEGYGLEPAETYVYFAESGLEEVYYDRMDPERETLKGN